MPNIDLDRQEALGVITPKRTLIEELGSVPAAYRETVFNQSSRTDISDRMAASGYGNSVYDKDILWASDYDNIEDFRARHQSAALKFLNGAGKMITTAATTYISGVLGTIYGIGQGIYNKWIDDDPDTGFKQGLWDNAVIRAMQSIQDKMEELLPNYYTEGERNNAWYNNIFTANFWGDKFLKNAGFTIGAMATMYTPGFKTSFGLGKGVQKALSISTKSTKALQRAENVGKYAMRFGNTVLASASEANIEAYNAAKSFMDNNSQYLEQAFDQKKKEINEQFDQDIAEGMSYHDALVLANQRNENIQKEYEDIKAEMKRKATSVGNNVFGLNMGILGISDNLQFARMLTGGWKANKSLLKREGVKFFVDGKETNNLKAWGKALAKGKANVQAVTKKTASNVAKGTLKNMFSEGMEELTQNLASGMQQANKSAYLNEYVKKRSSKGDPYSLYGHSINPEVTEELTDWIKALGRVWQDEFGKASAGGWEEFVLGALTGGMGSIGIRTKKNGKTGLTWQGGFYEAYQDVKAKNLENEQRTDIIKDYISKPEFKENVKHAVAAMSLAEDMDKALYTNDVMAFKNAQMMSVVNDANFFRNKGMLDAYKGYYEEIANGIDDKDVEMLKTLTDNQEKDVANSYASYYKGKSSDDIKAIVRKNAVSTLEKAESYLNTLDEYKVKNYDKWLEAAGGSEFIAINLLESAASTKALIDDMERRKKDLETEQATKRIDNKDAIKELNTQIKKSQKKLDTILNDPKKEIESFKKIEEIFKKQNAGKDRSATIERYRDAKTIQDVADVFFYTDPDQRSAFFKDALKSAEGDNKELLKQFKTFAEQAGSVGKLFDKHLRDLNIPLESNLGQSFSQLFGNFMDHTLSDISESETPMLNLADSIREYAEQIHPEKEQDADQREAGNDFKLLLERIAFDLDHLGETQSHQEEIQQKDEDVASATEEIELSNFEEETEAEQGQEQPVTTTPEENQITQQEQLTQQTQPAETPSSTPSQQEIPIGSMFEEDTTEEQQQSEGQTGETVEDKGEPAIATDNTSDATVEEELQENGSDEGTTQQEPVDKEQKQHEFVESQVSLDGTFHKYKVADARDKKPVEYKHRKEVEWINDIGIDLDYITNVLLPKIFRNNNKSLPVKFAGFRNSKGNIDKIYIVIDKNLAGDVKDNNLVDHDGYYIVGTISYPANIKESDSDERKRLTKAKQSQWNLIKNDLESVKESGTFDIVISNVRSTIYDYDNGVLLEDPVNYTNLANLVYNPETNPNGLNTENMAFTITEELGIRIINVDENDTIIPESDSTNIGTVALLLRNANGNLVPAVKLRPVTFNDSEVNRESKIWKNIQKSINDFVAAASEKEEDIRKNKQRKALGKLREMLVFSDTENHGMFFNNDASKQLYNHFIVKANGITVIDIDFNQPINDANSIVETINNAFNTLNPSFAVNRQSLSSSQSLKDLLDANILRTNVKTLYFENACPRVRPLNKEGLENVEFKPTPTTGVRIPASRIARRGFMINNTRYTTDGTSWYDNNGNAVDTVEDLNNIAAIVNNDPSVETIDEKNSIYLSGGRMYKRTGETNFYRLSQEQEEKERNKKIKKETEQKRKEDLKKLAESIKGKSNNKSKITEIDKEKLIQGSLAEGDEEYKKAILVDYVDPVNGAMGSGFFDPRVIINENKLPLNPKNDNSMIFILPNQKDRFGNSFTVIINTNGGDRGSGSYSVCIKNGVFTNTNGIVNMLVDFLRNNNPSKYSQKSREEFVRSYLNDVLDYLKNSESKREQKQEDTIESVEIANIFGNNTSESEFKMKSEEEGIDPFTTASESTENKNTVIVTSSGQAFDQKNSKKALEDKANSVNFVNLLNANKDIARKFDSSLKKKGIKVSGNNGIEDVLKKSKNKEIVNNLKKISSVKDLNDLSDLVESCEL